MAKDRTAAFAHTAPSGLRATPGVLLAVLSFL